MVGSFWRDVTESGARHCRYYIVLMTNGWQLSKECKFETDIVKNRLAKGEVTIIPVWFDSFDEKYDEQRGHYYKNSWNHFQGVPSKKMTQILLTRLFSNSSNL